MISTFFTTIPRCLFEPLAVCALLGILLSLWLCRARRNRLFWLVSSGLFFLIFWRVVVEIGSGRYASILIYPTVIFVSYLCFHVKELPGLTRIPERFQPFLPWSLLLLACVCLGKDFRFNRYEGYLRECADIARRDSACFQSPLALTYGKEVKRIGYYSGLPTLFYGKGDVIDRNASEISDLLKRHRNFGDALYLFVDEKRDASPITAESLGVSERKWSMLASCFQDNRRKKRLTLYRYLPGAIPWKIATQKDIEQFEREDKREMLFNGHFEQFEEKKHFHPFLQTLQPPGHSFYSRPNWQFPAGWGFESRVSNVNAVEAELHISELTGKHALRLSGRSRFIVFTRGMLPRGEYELSFLVHGRPETRFGISFYTYNNLGRFVAYRDAAHYRLASGEECLYHLRITEQEIGEGVQFRLCLVLYEGEIFWEGVSLLPAAENT